MRTARNERGKATNECRTRTREGQPDTPLAHTHLPTPEAGCSQIVLTQPGVHGRSSRSSDSMTALAGSGFDTTHKSVFMTPLNPLTVAVFVADEHRPC